ncbi:FkbM family methyltransferase [Magnetovibrio sp.]|uniref:FkbM family methyltransferase n=1 Tax=Magnetovibrio sp. TaxID=2024836 RepID=UPI002F92DC20
MKLHELYEQYASKELDKHSYISAMHQKHAILFDYFEYIKDTDIESITIDNSKIFVTMKETGIKLYLDPHDSRFIPIEILNFKSFDPVERGLIFDLAGKSKTIFDIGANIGWYTLNFCKLDTVERVHSFEPIPRTFDYLSRHIAFNACDKAVLNNFALSNENGEIEFFWNMKETGSSSMKNIQEREDSNLVTCQLRTLDDYVQETGAHIDMIKCDVEGSELMVFQGGLATIARDKPYIFTEMLRKWSAKFGYHPNDIVKLLADIGYHCFAYVDQALERIESVTAETEPTNFFFLHQDQHRDIIEQNLRGG